MVKSIVAKELQTSSTLDGPRVRFTVDASSAAPTGANRFVLVVMERKWKLSLTKMITFWRPADCGKLCLHGVSLGGPKLAGK